MQPSPGTASLSAASIRLRSLLAGSVLVFACVGCGPKTDRLPVSGKVTLDDQPLDGGSIQFTSMATDALLTSGGMINSGEYSIPRDKGLRPGTYHLEISAADNDAKPVRYKTGPGDPGVMTQPERIPPDYNIDSKRTVEITLDGDNEFDFDIVSKKS